METRMERNKRHARARRLRRFKLYIVFLLCILMVIGVNWVNNEAKLYNVLENPLLINIDFKNNIFTFLGEDYYIDFQILKRQD